MKGYPVIMNGTSDHVHLLTALPLTKSISDVVRDLKANSSKWLHQQGIQNFGWQRGYGVFSVSRTNIDRAYRYIQNQEEHHKKHTFQEEYLKFLTDHQVEYDPRYIWD